MAEATDKPVAQKPAPTPAQVFVSGSVDDRGSRLLEDVALKTAAEQADESDVAWLNEFTSDAIPSFRGDPNTHYFWATTTNQSDPLHRRLRMGYTMVKASDYPELASYAITQKGSEFEGYIMVNELILLSIPKTRYQRMMREFHENMPRSEEQAFRAKVESKSGEFTDGKGTPLVSIEGAALEMGTPVGSRDFE